MRGKVLRLWSYVLAVVLILPTGLWAASWQKVQWDKAPKDQEGNTEGINTLTIIGKNKIFFSWGGARLVEWDGKSSFKEIKYDGSGTGEWNIRNFVQISPKDIVAVGDNGLILHYNGSSWKPVKNPLWGKGRQEARLWGAGCASSKKCFAGTRSGELLESSGMEWKVVGKAGDPPAEGARIYAMAFPSDKLGWMAGESFFAKWDGSKWARADIEAPRIYDIGLSGKDSGWAVGDGGAFFQYDGKTFTKVNVKGSFFRMRGVACGAKNDCWAVGDAGASFHWDGKAWSKVKVGTFDRMNRVDVRHGLAIIGSDKGDILVYK